jgi:hypothetical protein
MTRAPSIHRTAVGAALAACFAVAAAPHTARAQISLGQALSTGGGLHEEESRFLPGMYYFHKGCEYYRYGDVESAIHAWEIAAGWAMKDAQYDLGIAYFRGLGVDVDRPRGIAWLALAAERKDEAFETSLAAAWDDATPVEQDRANEIWRELAKQYSDAAALPRAQNHFNAELNQITGSRVGMPGHVTVWSRTKGTLDGANYKAELQRLAARNFGNLPVGTVDVGPLEPVVDDERANK